MQEKMRSRPRLTNMYFLPPSQSAAMSLSVQLMSSPKTLPPSLESLVIFVYAIRKRIQIYKNLRRHVNERHWSLLNILGFNGVFYKAKNMTNALVIQTRSKNTLASQHWGHALHHTRWKTVLRVRVGNNRQRQRTAKYVFPPHHRLTIYIFNPYSDMKNYTFLRFIDCWNKTVTNEHL